MSSKFLRSFKYIFIVIFLLSCFNDGSANSTELAWWKTSIIYQVYPRSFKDSDGDGIGDLKGIEEKAQYFKDLGVGAVWLSPIYKSPMADFGYDITNYTEVYEKFGTIDDFKSLKKTLNSLGIKLLLDFVPNHTSDESEWFIKSVKKIDPYTNFYVWRDASGYDEHNKPKPPNNWISVFNVKSAWSWNEERGQFYLHEFLNKQPDLNYRCPELRKAMEDVIKFWLDAGVDGFRIDAVPYLVEDEKFPDEVYIHPDGDHNEYTNLVHNYTMDQPLTFEVIRSWRIILDTFTKNNNLDERVMLTEAYTDLKTTMKYYGNASVPISQMPFNFQLISKISPQSNVKDMAKSIMDWINLMPKGMWANWVIGNHDQFRVSKRYGVDLVDALNMLVTLLPGTTVTYYGEELGMEDTFIRWDQTVDPQGIVLGKEKYLTATRDACRTPMQWDDSLNAGFSTAEKTWLPVNPNFWRLNVNLEKEKAKSHYKVYRQLVEARKTPTIIYGDFNLYTPNNWTLIFTRSYVNYTTFITVINMGTEPIQPDLSELNISLPKEVYVYTASINSIYNHGDKLSTGRNSFYLRPKAALVLTTTPSSSAIIITSSLIFTIMVSIIGKLF